MTDVWARSQTKSGAKKGHYIPIPVEYGPVVLELFNTDSWTEVANRTIQMSQAFKNDEKAKAQFATILKGALAKLEE